MKILRQTKVPIRLRFSSGILVSGAVIFILLLTGQMAFADTVSPRLVNMYRQLSGYVNPGRLADTVRTLSSMGSRVAGYPGNAAAAQYVAGQFRQIGLQNIRVEHFPVTVAVNDGASITANGVTHTLYPLAPNLVQTCQLPPSGLTGHLIYAGNGALENFNGKNVAGSIVLMDFNSESKWLNAPRLGARAVIFIAPNTTMRGEAEDKVVSIPISIPRYWISKTEAAPLLAECSAGPPPIVTLHSNNPWKQGTSYNITGIIPGTDPKLRNQIIVIESYFDSTSVVPSLAPGADSSCGIAALLELARDFKANPPGRTIWFVATGDHFQALQGIREYLNRHINSWIPPNWFQRTIEGDHRKVPKIYLWCGLDLSSQTRGVGIFYKSWFYDIREDIQGQFSDIARVCRENAAKIGTVLGFNSDNVFADGVNPVNGKNWRNYIPGKPAFDSEAVTMARANGVTFASVDDSRSLWDTPYDTFSHVNIANLTFQTKLIACLMGNIVHDSNAPGGVNAQRMPITDPSTWSRMDIQGGFATVEGKLEMFNPKKSFIAYPNPVLRGSIAVLRNRTKFYMGVQGDMLTVVNNQNEYVFHGVAPLTALNNNQPVRLAAYHLNSDGQIDYAPDRGVTGAELFPLDVMITTSTKVTPIMMFRCVPTAVYDLVDQQSLSALNTLTILNGETNGEPRMYGYAFDPQDPGLVGSYVEDMAVVFAQPGSRFKIMMGYGPANTRFLLINATPKYPQGIGYLVGGSPSQSQNGVEVPNGSGSSQPTGNEIARGGAIYDTALHVAEDMWQLDNFRINRLGAYRIINKGIDDLHRRAAAAIQLAKKALAQKDYERFDAYSRAAWGYESRAYPDVQQTATDVVEGVLFYLMLLLPFAYFGERLLFGFHDLKRQLSAAAGIFCLIFLGFYFVHPAFKITMDPVIVFLAFVMLALSVIVIALISGKFEEELKKMNREVGGVHKADIGRVSVAVAAFNLGVSNMRRRKARTPLTTITLIVLTFAVLSFTSIVQELRFNKVPAPGLPRYSGIMIRTPMWDPLQDPALRILKDEYGNRYPVAGRAWFFGTQLGQQSFLTLKRGGLHYDAKALVGLTPQEANITHPQTALTAGRWFKQGDVYTVILPDVIAAALGISSRDVGKAHVSYAGVDYTVIGILNSQRFKQIRDLDNEPLTPVDFLLMQQISQQQGGGGNQNGFREYTHLEPDATFFIPYRTAVNLGAQLRSIAVNFGNPKMVASELNPLMHRLDLNLYAGMITHPNAVNPRDRGHIERYSTLAATSSSGFGSIILLIAIASLIVLNTMLSSVYERIREIHVFSSIGLAPHHIGMLFMAEALVYAILGSVSGYLLGQFVTKLLVWTGWLPNLYLNYSSVSAVLTTLIVVGVVLLSTIFPARKAAEVATPAIDRTWHVPEPEGDHWTIPLPFAVTGEQASGLNGFLKEWFAAYEEYSIGDFVTQNVEAESFEVQGSALLASLDGGRTRSSATISSDDVLTGHRIRSMVWVAPFDLGVSQKICIETRPTEMADVYDIRLYIDRESGDISNWKRVNRRFLNTLRKQFLIWRTLKQADRERYLITGAAPTAGVAPGIAGRGLDAPAPATD